MITTLLWLSLVLRATTADVLGDLYEERQAHLQRDAAIALEIKQLNRVRVRRAARRGHSYDRSGISLDYHIFVFWCRST